MKRFFEVNVSVTCKEKPAAERLKKKLEEVLKRAAKSHDVEIKLNEWQAN